MNRRLRRLRGRRQRKFQSHWPTAGSLTPSSSGQDWQRFDADLSQLETSVQVLRQRFEQVRQLQAEQLQIEQQMQSPGLSPEEISQLQSRLEDLEIQLESSLFDWRSLREPFWQAVRYGGLGIVIGWILRSLIGR
jgi:predicted RNase H-like nuclease (RuvC/YqgF family)